MKIHGRAVAMAASLVLISAGCAPEGKSVEEADVAADAAQAVAEEQPAPPAANVEPAAVPGKQVSLLGKTVDIPFEYKQAYDRVRPGANGVEERQIGLTTAAVDHKEVAVQLEGALKQAGFETRASNNKDDWVWITVVADAGQSKVAVRPEKNKPGTVVVFKVPKA